MESHFKFSENEHVINSFNKHWITYVRPFFMYFVALAVGVAFYVLATSVLTEHPRLSLFFLILMIGDIFLATHGLFIALLSNQISRWVITNKRIIDFRFIPYLKHDTEHIQLTTVSDISKRKHGLLQIIFNYGVVKIFAMKPLAYHYVPKPSLFVNLIEDLRNIEEFTQKDLESMRKIY